MGLGSLATKFISEYDYDVDELEIIHGTRKRIITNKVRVVDEFTIEDEEDGESEIINQPETEANLPRLLNEKISELERFRSGERTLRDEITKLQEKITTPKEKQNPSEFCEKEGRTV